MEQELEYLGRATDNPARPYVAILGGAKISDKILVVENLLAKCDTLIIGGGMANTFLAGQRLRHGRQPGGGQLRRNRQGHHGQGRRQAAAAGGCGRGRQVRRRGQQPGRRCRQGARGLAHHGHRSRRASQLFGDMLKTAKLVVWNGPMGVFEMPKFAEGTFAIARLLAEIGATTVIGGGDSASAVKKAGVAKKMTHVSTGGGAISGVPRRQGAAGRGRAERQVGPRPPRRLVIHCPLRTIIPAGIS